MNCTGLNTTKSTNITGSPQTRATSCRMAKLSWQFMAKLHTFRTQPNAPHNHAPHNHDYPITPSLPHYQKFSLLECCARLPVSKCVDLDQPASSASCSSVDACVKITLHCHTCNPSLFNPLPFPDSVCAVHPVRMQS